MRLLVLDRPRRRAAALVLSLAAGGCGSHDAAPTATVAALRPTSTLSASYPGLPATASPPRPAALAASGPGSAAVPLGGAQTVAARTGRLLVTIRAVIDPLRNAGAALPPGDRPVGVPLELRVLQGSYDSTASGDVVLVTAGGAAAPAFVRQGACATTAVDFESEISAGEQRSGCVAFAVPSGARVLGVGFRPEAQAGAEAVWRIRPGSAG